MADAGWVRVAAAADVAEGQVHGVRVGGLEIAVYHLPGGDYRATDNICSHEYAQLSDGWLENGAIETRSEEIRALQLPAANITALQGSVGQIRALESRIL